VYDEVQQYIDARNTAEAVQNEKVRALRRTYNAAHGDVADAAYSDYLSAARAAEAECRITINTAWNALRQHPDPLVGWIVDNCKDWQAQAQEVLQVLPATFDELSVLAEEQDWCHVWDRFRDQAIDAGVLDAPEPRDVSDAREELLTWLDDEHEVRGYSAVKALHKYLDAIVHAEA
jgi:hypothetical protein